jgi:NAD-dependent DNA ligase
MNIPLDCQTVSITGELENLTRNQAAYHIKQAGGDFTSSLPDRTTLLVRGSKAGDYKVGRACEIGAAVISEDDLMEMLGLPYTPRIPGLLVECA